MFYNVKKESRGEKQQQRINLSQDLWWNSIFTRTHTGRQNIDNLLDAFEARSRTCNTRNGHKGNVWIVCNIVTCHSAILLFAHNLISDNQSFFFKFLTPFSSHRCQTQWSVCVYAQKKACFALHSSRLHFILHMNLIYLSSLHSILQSMNRILHVIAHFPVMNYLIKI